MTELAGKNVKIITLFQICIQIRRRQGWDEKIKAIYEGTKYKTI